jgi:5-methylcytosine-specific restriction endonuclease McrA
MHPLSDDDERVCRLLRHIRSRYDHHTYVRIKLYKPLCHGCKHSESRFMERETPVPNVFPDTWDTDYQWYGVTAYRVRLLRKLVREKEWLGPDCFYCGTSLAFESGEPFYVNSGSLDEYFTMKVHKGKRPLKWMKDILFEVYKGRCAACRKKLTTANVTYDHIIPRHRSGDTALDNLQPLCRNCNQDKANRRPVEIEWGDLAFPLLPPNDKLWVT